MKSNWKNGKQLIFEISLALLCLHCASIWYFLFLHRQCGNYPHTFSNHTFREINDFIKEVTKHLISRNIFSARVSYYHTVLQISNIQDAIPFLFQMEVGEWLTNRQYPSMRSAIFSASRKFGQVTVKSSDEPATLNCNIPRPACWPFGDLSRHSKVWMDWMWLNSVIWVAVAVLSVV